MILDDAGEIVDFVAWGYSAGEIDSFSGTINGRDIFVQVQRRNQVYRLSRGGSQSDVAILNSLAGDRLWLRFGLSFVAIAISLAILWRRFGGGFLEFFRGKGGAATVAHPAPTGGGE